MTRTRSIASLLLLAALCLARPAHAQFAVAESGPMTLTHTASLFQQTINTTEALFHSTQWILELTGFDDTGVTLDDLLALEGLITQTQVVLWDLQSLDTTLRSLFALDSAPRSSGELQHRLAAIRGCQYEILAAAWRLQTLGSQLKKTVVDMRILWDRILRITGNKQGHQQTHALLTEIQKTHARAELSQAAYQQAMLSGAAEQLLIDASLERINSELFATMPRR